jgi:hypothetical protein
MLLTLPLVLPAFEKHSRTVGLAGEHGGPPGSLHKSTDVAPMVVGGIAHVLTESVWAWAGASAVGNPITPIATAIRTATPRMRAVLFRKVMILFK